MAVKIPIYEQQTSAPAMRAAPTLNPSAQRVANPLEGLGDDIQRVTNSAKGYLDVVAKQDDEDARVYAGQVVSDAHVKWQETYLQRQAEAGPGAPEFTPKLLGDYDKWSAEAISQAPNEASKKYLQQHLTSYRTSLGTNAVTFESGAKIAYRVDTTQKSIDSWGKTVATNPTEQQLGLAMQSIRETMPDVGADKREKLLEYAEKTLRTSAWASLVQRDPTAAKKMIDGAFGVGEKTPQTPGAQPAASGSSFQSVMPFVFKKEGGFNSNDGDGSPVNFGINQRANPDIDVRNLTKEKAAEIYKSRYWDKIGGDKLPANVALMAMDAAVNQGVGFANKMIAQAGGDVQKMAQLRRERYEQIIQDNPSKEKYRKNWMSRVDAALNEGNAVTGSPSPQATEKISSASGLVGMTPISELLHWQNQAEQETNKISQQKQTELRVEVQTAQAQAQNGVQPTGTPKTLEEFQSAFKDPVVAQKEYEQYASARQTASEVVASQSKPSAELAAIANAEIPAGSDATTIANTNIKQRAAVQILKAREQDPWNEAMTTKQVKTEPLQMGTPEFFTGIVTRSAARPVIAEKYGFDPGLLSVAESKQAANALRTMTPDKKAEALGMLASTITDRGAFVKLMNQIAPDSPVTRMAAGMMLYPTQKGVSETILKGEAMLNQSPLDKKNDGKPTALPIPTDDKLKMAFLNSTGGAFMGQGQLGAARFEESFQAVRAYYAARAFETGKITADKTMEPDSDLMEEAINSVTGGVYKWGKHTTFVPWGMKIEKFEEELPTRIQKTLEGAGYGATSWKNYDLSELDNGRYQLTIAGRAVPNALIDFNKPIPGSGATGKWEYTKPEAPSRGVTGGF